MSDKFQRFDYFKNNIGNIYYAIQKVNINKDLFNTFRNSRTFSFMVKNTWWDEGNVTIKYNDEYFKGLFQMFLTFNGDANGMFFVGKESFEVSTDENMITSSKKRNSLSKKAKEYFSVLPYERLKLILPIYFLFVAEQSASEKFDEIKPQESDVQYLNLVIMISKHLKIFDDEFKQRQRNFVENKIGVAKDIGMAKKRGGVDFGLSGLFSSVLGTPTDRTFQYILIKSRLDIIPYHLNYFLREKTFTIKDEYIVM